MINGHFSPSLIRGRTVDHATRTAVRKRPRRTRYAITVAAVVGAFLAWQVGMRSQSPAFDVVVRGGRVIDGTGNPWFIADIGIKGDSITAIAPRLNATGARVVDATGLVVSPGF